MSRRVGRNKVELGGGRGLASGSDSLLEKKEGC